MTKKPKTTKSTKPAEPITEREARAVYIACAGRRSVAAVRKRLGKGGRKTPSQTTFEKWCTQHQWVRLAREHDEKVATRVAEKIAEAATASVVTRAAQFDTLATETLKMAIDGLRELDVAGLKATDIRALAEISERAAKMHELLEGRATDRTDNMTREKMDALMEEMEKELEERLARVPTMH